MADLSHTWRITPFFWCKKLAEELGLVWIGKQTEINKDLARGIYIF
jgi:hypothetical protein